jgi:hypothetical protein
MTSEIKRSRRRRRERERLELRDSLQDRKVVIEKGLKATSDSSRDQYDSDSMMFDYHSN